MVLRRHLVVALTLCTDQLGRHWAELTVQVVQLLALAR